jgi:hypothetical protein
MPGVGCWVSVDRSHRSLDRSPRIAPFLALMRPTDSIQVEVDMSAPSYRAFGYQLPKHQLPKRLAFEHPVLGDLALAVGSQVVGSWTARCLAVGSLAERRLFGSRASSRP